MWRCKDCDYSCTRRSELLKHYRLDHQHYGRHHPYLCLYENCPFSCKTWNALKKHLSTNHFSQQSSTEEISHLKCHVCGYSQLSTETDFFHHIGQHLKNNESVPCMYVDCSYQTNIYGSFHTHKWRKHKVCTVGDLKPGIVHRSIVNPSALDSSNSDTELNEDLLFDEPTFEEPRDLTKDVELKLASVLLKLEHSYLVSSAAVNLLLEELQYLIGTVSVPVTQKTITQFLGAHNCQVDGSLVQDLATEICTSHPIQLAIGTQGPLSTAWKRNKYYITKFSVVEPVEFVIDQKNRRSFQYIPVLKTLQQVLNCETILSSAVNLNEKLQSVLSEKQVYRCLWDGAIFKENTLFSNECAVSLILYIDDFEVCNPLGTSRKKHKICAIYWILGNLPPGSHSSLSSIYLAALINSDDVKLYGYDIVLEPLISDILILEQHGIFVPKLGKCVKGTIQCVVADNLGAHGIAGFLESFSGAYICRFCTATKLEIQTRDVGSEAFSLRTEEGHGRHLKTLEEESLVNCFGVKRRCVLSEKLTHFNVTTGFPPDIVHDLFEGIVPVEVALCLSVLTSKYFTLNFLNDSIKTFPFKWTDKANCPHPVPLTYKIRRTVGGNSHENWSLIRFLPLLLGQKVPADEPAWNLLTDLKDIVDLVVTPVHTDETIAYLNFKISEHRVRFKEVFPDTNLLPKHHFLEHYPQLIRQFGPLVSLWTLRFEAKHSFFKRVVRHTRCFKNVLLSLAQRHQLSMAHHIYTCGFPKPLLEVKKFSTVSIDVLKDDIARAVKHKNPNVKEVSLAENVTYNGFNYRLGMILAHGSLEGMPAFIEIIQMVVLQKELVFIVRKLSAWYLEHFRAYQLEISPTKEIEVLEPSQLTDPYPLADYTVGTMRLITLKRYIHV
ncbi:uncharacterized protein LOC132461193 isoform X1 [Gadus macrocephalus]|uniref:uncharacterized protein LOC132450740 isoform X1 n=2 Tax=Gadus macrocephalus TaxID=80720 RepID=UPI0028CB7F8D|nr:uncharacterized protein LOC132450740 isoform X1 [Gadus macrocephalus]XP_059912218.1 uncharacterized protein LOC132461192 isoform X1 [Gadus macrocephalus]XP_059912219.1 uncharacterized protein LOC132461192 isoform X1 [Gadus macrocephalus]XP_059912224.1 uncharacterized protein LOC132461193 isoform X1 [Gadus macrocephalus]